jgi:hypothetical protein
MCTMSCVLRAPVSAGLLSSRSGSWVVMGDVFLVPAILGLGHKNCPDTVMK